MSALTELAMDIASIPDLAKLPIKVVPLSEAETGGREMDRERVEIDPGSIVVSIFHRKGMHPRATEGATTDWHYQLTVYTPEGQSAGPGLDAADTAIDRVVHFLRQHMKAAASAGGDPVTPGSSA